MHNTDIVKEASNRQCWYEKNNAGNQKGMRNGMAKRSYEGICSSLK